MTDGPFPRKVLLIPGLFYLRWMLLPLQHTLRKHGFEAEVWDTDQVTAPLAPIVARLSADLQSFAAGPSPVGLVTYSFGDWLARAALAELPDGLVDRVVSLAPVMTESPAARWAEPWFGRWLPPLRVMVDRQAAASGLPWPQGIGRLVVWARWDLLIRRVPLRADGRTAERCVWGTHVLLLTNPRMHRMVHSFLRDLPT